MRVEKREFAREFLQLSDASVKRGWELMRVTNITDELRIDDTQSYKEWTTSNLKRFLQQTASIFPTLINSHDWSNAHKLLSTLIKIWTSSKLMRVDEQCSVLAQTLRHRFHSGWRTLQFIFLNCSHHDTYFAYIDWSILLTFSYI